MTTPPNADDLSALLDEPGRFFAFCWRLVEAHVGVLFSHAWAGRGAAECAVLRNLILEAPGPGLPVALVRYALGPCSGVASVPEPDWAQRLFVVMCALDEACAAIHPGAARRGPRVGGPLAPALRRMREDRIVNGSYGEFEDCAVVPKGPLARGAGAHEPDASGDRLDTQFASLSVVRLRARPHAVRLDVFDAGAAGIRTIERVGVAAIAEDADDILFRALSRNGQSRLHAEPVPALTQRAAAAVIALTGQRADMVVLPELVVSPDAVRAIRDGLADARDTGGPVPALAVLGSGLSAETDEAGLSYNECVVVDGGGDELWRQRKLHHFSMDPDNHMVPCGLTPVGTDKHREDTRSGEVLEVRDLPGIGRVAVLICEDLEQPNPSNLLLDLRPDWIVTPVLDRCLGVGRWTFQRATELSRTTGTNLVVATSATLEVRQRGADTLANALAGAEIQIGLLRSGCGNRRYRLLSACAAGPCMAVEAWTPAGWPVFATR